VLSFLVCPPPSHAQPLSIRGSLGFVYLPLADWTEYFGQGHDSYYQKNNPNTYYALSLVYALSEHHALSIGTELIRTSASLSNNAVVIDWSFQGIPVTLGYEYRFPLFNEHFTPVAGVGVSYFICRAEATDHFFHYTLERKGRGYGIHGSLGLLADLTRSLSLLTQARYRYSNGMAFSGNPGDVRVEFTGFDVSVGLAWNF